MKINTALQSIISKDGNVEILEQFLGITSFVILFIGIFPTLIIVEHYFGSGVLAYLLAIIGVNIVLIGSGFILYQIGTIPYRVMCNLGKKGQMITTLLRDEEDKISRLDTILQNLDLLQSIMKRFSIIKKILCVFLTKKTNHALNIYTDIIYRDTISLIQDLRSDLSIRLTEQQSILEGAKSEVEKNITGSTELNQVSELQRSRLDRQIEQFEELQRVLVRV